MKDQDPRSLPQPPPLSRFDLISLGISLLGMTAVAASALLVLRLNTGDNETLTNTIIGLLLLTAGAQVAHYVTLAIARQQLHLRIARMREAAQQLGLGDLLVTVPEGIGDLGLLGQSLNTMSSRISRLLSAQRDLLSGVSHELRSPLARIEVSLELIDRGLDGKPEERELIEGIREEVALLEKHISRLLEAQRVSKQRVLLERKPLTLDALVQRVMQRETLRLRELGFSTELDLKLGDAEILGDENALDRVLSTLVENTMRHASQPREEDGEVKPPELKIQTTHGPMGAIVRVMDRGPGLNAEQCMRVFEPFYRTDASRNAQTGGTGLGMYLTRRICKAHSGQVRALPREGGGLIVELTLPLRGQRELKDTIRVQLDPNLLEDEDADPALDADTGLDIKVPRQEESAEAEERAR